MKVMLVSPRNDDGVRVLLVRLDNGWTYYYRTYLQRNDGPMYARLDHEDIVEGYDHYERRCHNIGVSHRIIASTH